MGKEESIRFVCSECGYSSSKWMGRCPDCGAWNSFSEEKVVKQSAKSPVLQNVSSTLLSEVPYESEFRFKSGISEMDRVLGGGIVYGSAILVGGEPGIGKSTMMMQLASNCGSNKKVLYISGEESGSQVRQRAERLGVDLTKINILCETKMESICQVVDKEKPQVMIVDSLQTLTSQEVSSTAGSVSQMRTCCLEIVSHCKASGTAVFFIGHVTKEGTIAGPKIIEHMVDTVIYFEQASMGVRLVRAAKNRFGSVDEIGIFLMKENGLEGVKDPSSFFISQRQDATLPPGIAYTAVCEGTRTFLVEIQALIVDAKTGYSRVYSDKVESSRVLRIAAILERHGNIRLTDKDIYVNVAGGVKVDDVSVDLALAVALWSAANNVNLPAKMVCFGELSLAGEVRPISYSERRLKAAAEMGFTKALVAYPMKLETKLKLIECRKIKDAFIS